MNKDKDNNNLVDNGYSYIDENGKEWVSYEEYYEAKEGK